MFALKTPSTVYQPNMKDVILDIHIRGCQTFDIGNIPSVDTLLWFFQYVKFKRLTGTAQYLSPGEI